MPATTCCATFRCASAKRIRNIDLACRYGGEEFVAGDAGDRQGGRDHGCRAIAAPHRSQAVLIANRRQEPEVTISIGIAAAAGANDGASAILKRADQALYRAKRDGRNRVVPDAA